MDKREDIKVMLLNILEKLMVSERSRWYQSEADGIRAKQIISERRRS